MVEHDFLGENSSQLGIQYFEQGQDLRLTSEQSKKVQYSRNQAIKNSLNEAILPMSINEALLSR